MTNIALNLVVLRCADIEASAMFYTVVGLHFTRHRHGQGQEHYAAEFGAAVFELYPTNAKSEPSTGARVGFSVPSVDEAVQRVREKYPSAVVSVPSDSPWGRRAVLVDPDGHRVEVTQPVAQT